MILSKITKIMPQRVPLKTQKQQNTQAKYDESEWSDHNPTDVDAETYLAFHRPGVREKQLRDLRRGHVMCEAVLDLHGKTVIEARRSLQQFLTLCRERRLRSRR